jgi:UrcA family protein
MTTLNNKQTAAFTTTVAIALVALSCATSAHAGSAADPLTKTVAYGDLNLDSQSGAKALYARLRGAARAVCSPLEDRDLAHRMAWQSCINQAIRSSVTRINNRMVTSVYEESNGKPAG